MIDLIERIGPYLGIAAFLGLAVLAFLIFQQAREVRRLATALAGVRARLSRIYAAIDRRSPFDPRYFLVVIAAGVVAAAVLTSGFGLFGDDGAAPAEERGGNGKEKEEKVEVTVLNATQDDSGPVPVAGVQGLADDIAKEVVKPAGFAIGEKTDAPTGFNESTIMFEPDEEAAAQDLAEGVADQLGETDVQPITSEVADVAGGAPLVLIVGQDDAEALE